MPAIAHDAAITGKCRAKSLPSEWRASRKTRWPSDMCRHTGAGDHVARRKLLARCHFNEASAGLVDQRRALAAVPPR